MQRFTSSTALMSTAGLLAVAAAASLYWLTGSGPALAEPASITISASPIAWDPENPRETQAGSLTYIGGLELTSDHSDFGGLSGLIVGKSGDALIAVTDQGNWFTADILADGDRPTGLADALLAPILDASGEQLSGKRHTDAESLTVAFGADPRNSPTLVGFERNHRLQSHDLTSLGFEASAAPIEDFGVFDNLENNGGLEAIASLPDGSLLAISEKTFDEDGHIIGARLTTEGATPVRLKQHLPYALTDIDVLPNGDLITLERHYSALAGVSMMMRRIPAVALEGDKPLDGEVLVEANHTRSIDNMEGLSIRQDSEGRTLLYLVSDDNFNTVQRTLLLVFALGD
ncbi:MAG: esterase-like activity of phytase family protein [Rhodobiaceae bacterium]|nr:esterase-like activity of phytase family protein [Rhodobiaceae bacterium]